MLDTRTYLYNICMPHISGQVLLGSDYYPPEDHLLDLLQKGHFNELWLQVRAFEVHCQS
jgi:hypothetical protein